MPADDVEREDIQRADDLAAQCIRETVKVANVQPHPPPPKGRRAPWIAMLAGVAVIAVQVPTLRASFKATPSIRLGPAPIDEGTEACIDRLWEISGLIQEGELPGDLPAVGLTDPLTHAPYVVRPVDGELVVECPNPALHALAELRVTESQPVPEAVP